MWPLPSCGGHAPRSLALKPGELGNFQTALLGKIRPALTPSVLEDIGGIKQYDNDLAKQVAIVSEGLDGIVPHGVV